jgi:hypothetical protein
LTTNFHSERIVFPVLYQRALQADEKENIRKKLLTMLEEPSPRVGQLLSFLIGKIARRDWPQYWSV